MSQVLASNGVSHFGPGNITNLSPPLQHR